MNVDISVSSVELLGSDVIDQMPNGTLDQDILEHISCRLSARAL